MDKQIRHWMTPDPVTINGDNSLSVAYNLMRLNHLRHLPVIDDDEELIGIITWGDVREAKPKAIVADEERSAWEEHFLAATQDVRNFMTPTPYHVAPDASVRRAAMMMMEHKIGGLPVVEDGRVIGIVTETDLFRFIIDTWPEIEEELPWAPERVT